DAVRDTIDSPRYQHPDNPTDSPDHRRLDKEDHLDLAILGADRFHDPDFARAFEYRHDHRVRNSKRSHQQRDPAKQTEHRVDDQKHRPYLLDLIDDRETSKTELRDLPPHFRQMLRIANAHDSRFVTLVLTFTEVSATTREGERDLAHRTTMLNRPVVGQLQRNVDLCARE